MVDTSTLIEFFENRIPFNKLLGIKIEALEPGHALLRTPYRDELIGDPARPALHGGVLSAMIDAAGGLAVFASLDKLGPVATIDLRVDYLRAGLLEDIWCDATLIRAGNRVAVTSMRVLQGADRSYLTAEGRGVYNILRADRALEGR